MAVNFASSFWTYGQVSREEALVKCRPPHPRHHAHTHTHTHTHTHQGLDYTPPEPGLHLHTQTLNTGARVTAVLRDLSIVCLSAPQSLRLPVLMTTRGPTVTGVVPGHDISFTAGAQAGVVPLLIQDRVLNVHGRKGPFCTGLRTAWSVLHRPQNSLVRPAQASEQRGPFCTGLRTAWSV